MSSGGFSIPSGHPAFDGHFPDFPVVPGSMVLDQILALWGKPYQSLTRVKFYRPLEPDIRVGVAFETLSGGAVEFVCRGDVGTVCSGRIEPFPDGDFLLP